MNVKYIHTYIHAVGVSFLRGASVSCLLALTHSQFFFSSAGLFICTGPACYIRDSMPLALFLAYKYADDTGAALLANANLGGEACYRGAMLGALLGANNGFANGGLRPQHLISGLPVDLRDDVQVWCT